MKKLITLILFIFTINITCAQEFNFEAEYNFNIKDVEIVDLGVFYSSLIFKPVFVDTRLRGKTINADYFEKLTRYQTIDLIKKYFIMNGIEIKEYKEYVIFILKE
jgi:hypothetical protein